jgi:hypothetical protein
MRSMLGSVLAALVAAFLMTGAGTAMAAETPTWLCVPETAGQTVTSGGSEGKCEAKDKTVELPPTAELATLQSILPDIKYVASGVAGKPTIQFGAVNVQVISGSGSTSGTVNGEGNLVIGYDKNEGKHEQTGSHNLILGEEQTFTSYGGVLAGFHNTLSGSYSSVTGGEDNTVSGSYGAVTGGVNNTVSGKWSSVTGGDANTTTGDWNAVTGGEDNTASGVAGAASVSGGYENAAGSFSSISGGEKNKATGTWAWVGGGFKNTASGHFASIFGGKELVAEKEYEAIP